MVTPLVALILVDRLLRAGNRRNLPLAGLLLALQGRCPQRGRPQRQPHPRQGRHREGRDHPPGHHALHHHALDHHDQRQAGLQGPQWRHIQPAQQRRTAAAWTATLGLYLAVYTPWLLAPQLDGKDS